MGRPKREDTEKKMTVLQAIRDNKKILFGKFSSDLEKLNIDSAWEEVCTLAKNLALVPEKSSAAHIRRLYSQWKSRTLEKKDNKGKTGTGGGKENKFNEADNLILDILDKNSPVVEGLNVCESGDYSEEDGLVVENEDIVFDERDVNDAMADTVAEASSTLNSDHPIRTKRRKLAGSEKEALLDDKWKAQIELLKQQAYNMKLQNYKLEIELGLPPSEFTKSLYADS